MTRTSITTIITIIISGIFLLFNQSCQQNQSSAQGTPSNAKSLSIAYVKLDTLIESYHYYSDKKTELLAETQQKQADIETRYRTLQRKLYDLQSKVQNRMMTPTKAQKEQEKIARDEQKILSDKQLFELEILEKNQELTKGVLDSVKNYVRIFNKDHKYNLVLTNDTLGSTILFADDYMDITADILEGLNKRYIKKSNATK